MTIYRDIGQRNIAGIALDGLDDFTIHALAGYVMECPTDLERRLTVSVFAANCGELGRLKAELRERESCDD